MIKINHGPAMDRPEGRFAEDFDASFRMVVDYDVCTDGYFMRFDVVLSTGKGTQIGSPGRGEQINAAIATSSTQNSLIDLMVPNKGVQAAHACILNAKDLCEALRGLADAVEGKLNKVAA